RGTGSLDGYRDGRRQSNVIIVIAQTGHCRDILFDLVRFDDQSLANLRDGVRRGQLNLDDGSSNGGIRGDLVRATGPELKRDTRSWGIRRRVNQRDRINITYGGVSDA